MMRKFLISLGIALAFALTAYFSYRFWEESRTAKGVTISVKDSSNSPIPAAIIRLEKIDIYERLIIAIQHQTDQNGKIYFKSLTHGFYLIRATRLYCGKSRSPAQTMGLNIPGQNNQIQYFPCGNQ